MGDKPAGQVYFMPAASDAYVAGFRWGVVCACMCGVRARHGIIRTPHTHVPDTLTPPLALPEPNAGLYRHPLPCRNWLGSTAGGGPWGPMNLANYLQRAGPRLPESQLLDHYHSHTERCHICQPALRNVRAARGVAAAVGAVAAAVAVAALVLQFAVQSSALSPAVAQAAGVPGVPALAAVPRLVGLAGVCGAVALLCFLAWRWCQNTIPRFFSGERPFARNRVAGEYAP